MTNKDSLLMRNIPNFITALRILLSIILLNIKPFSVLFIFIYILCGFSDIADGYIARKYLLVSKFGSRLDSLADFIFVFTMIYILLTNVNISKALIYWIILIAIIRIISCIISFIKFNKLSFLHTYLNKFTGVVLFVIPVFIINFDINILGCIACIIASISAIEELIINIWSEDLDLDINGIWRLPLFYTDTNYSESNKSHKKLDL